MINLNLREFVLNRRAEFLSKNSDAFRGNTFQRKEYLKFLEEKEIQLTDWQFDAAVGLMLSDASAQSAKNKKSVRLKMQQSLEHKEFLQHTKNIFLEYTASDADLTALSGRKNMFEFQTMTVPQFCEVACLFYPQFEKNGTKGTKTITDSIQRYITPVSVAYWFCGDGGRSDFSSNEGKGITFHTQGFSEAECNILAQTLHEKFKFDAMAKQDDLKKKQFRVDISGRSFDHFIQFIGPYIHKSMTYKLPTPRKEDNRFGFANQFYCQEKLSSAFDQNNRYIVSYKRISS
jgi:hypothetical protein